MLQRKWLLWWQSLWNQVINKALITQKWLQTIISMHEQNINSSLQQLISSTRLLSITKELKENPKKSSSHKVKRQTLISNLCGWWLRDACLPLSRRQRCVYKTKQTRRKWPTSARRGKLCLLEVSYGIHYNGDRLHIMRPHTRL